MYQPMRLIFSDKPIPRLRMKAKSASTNSRPLRQLEVPRNIARPDPVAASTCPR
jgi:hypothetical protein